MTSCCTHLQTAISNKEDLNCQGGYKNEYFKNINAKSKLKVTSKLIKAL